MRLGSGEDEFDMRRRLFNCFEQSVPCGFGEHVNFVNDIYFVTPRHGQMHNLFREFAHIFSGVAACSVDLYYIE